MRNRQHCDSSGTQYEFEILHCSAINNIIEGEIAAGTDERQKDQRDGDERRKWRARCNGTIVKIARNMKKYILDKNVRLDGRTGWGHRERTFTKESEAECVWERRMVKLGGGQDRR